jgi:hypothetical protein
MGARGAALVVVAVSNGKKKKKKKQPCFFSGVRRRWTRQPVLRLFLF